MSEQFLIVSMLLTIEKLKHRVSELEEQEAWRLLLEQAKERGITPEELLKETCREYQKKLSVNTKQA